MRPNRASNHSPVATAGSTPGRIFHVHLRDYRHDPAGKVVWTAVGQGEFDNLGQIRALLKDGYKETFTIETHWRDPQGKLYSTETSLKSLLKNHRAGLARRPAAPSTAR